MSKLPCIFRSIRNGRRFFFPLASVPSRNIQRQIRSYSQLNTGNDIKAPAPVNNTEHEEHQYEENVKNRILERALEFVTKSGWSVESLSAGAEAAGYPGITHGLFPNGGGDLVHYFNVKCNESLVVQMKSWPKEQLAETKVPAKFIENAIMTRLTMIEPYKTTWPKAMAIQALPNNVPNCLATLLSLVDDICYHSGDRSVDFNWYIRRVGLAGIYKASELFYLTDSSPNNNGTRSFITARIRDAELLRAALSLNPVSATPQTLSAAFVTDAQFGFRSGLSTETAIFGLKRTVKYYTDRQTPIYACFLDLSKAFDFVSYDILWQKLNKAGLPYELVSLFKFWYLNQENRVRWAGEFSDPCRMECGVRQGGLSSPLLFSLYVDALIGELIGTHVGCFIDGVCINNLSYADDMVLLAPSVSALRKLLAVCESYAGSHGLVYNVKKTEFMVFKAGNKCPNFVPPVVLNGVPLKRVYHFKYLGHIVTDDLKDDADMEKERRALSVRANMLARRFGRCTDTVKTTLFKAYCTSLYSASLWFKYTQKSYNALRVQFNNAFRALLRLPRYCSASGMFADARVDGFDAVWRKRTASLLHRLRGSGNSILKAIADRPDCPLMWKLIQRTKSVLVIRY